MFSYKTHCFTPALQIYVANVTTNQIFITIYDYNHFYDPSIKLKPYKTKDFTYHDTGKELFVSSLPYIKNYQSNFNAKLISKEYQHHLYILCLIIIIAQEDLHLVISLDSSIICVIRKLHRIGK